MYVKRAQNVSFVSLVLCSRARCFGTTFSGTKSPLSPSWSCLFFSMAQLHPMHFKCVRCAARAAVMLSLWRNRFRFAKQSSRCSEFSYRKRALGMASRDAMSCENMYGMLFLFASLSRWMRVFYSWRNRDVERLWEWNMVVAIKI